MIVKDIRRAVFLDRDGTISPDEFGYISDAAGYSLYPETGEALRILQSLGYLLIIVTNQSGIARGYFSPDDLEKVHQKMHELLLAEGVRLDAVYYSPYYEGAKIAPYNILHEDRKPGLGMFKKAQRDFQFQAARSFMIGDRLSDIEFGRSAGLKSILLKTGDGKAAFQRLLDGGTPSPHYVADNILVAAQFIEKYF